MQLVELEPLADVFVGQPDEGGLSIEQRKRLTIAVELVASPSIMFLDEPTSGESRSCVLSQLKPFFSRGISAFCTGQGTFCG